MTRVVVLLAVAVLAALGVGAVAYAEVREQHERAGTEPSVAHVDATALPDGTGRIVFRHTGLDQRYGVVAEVALDDPSGPRAFTDTTCDRVYATDRVTSCLVTERGVVTSYRLDELDADGEVLASSALPGIPSRTRLSPDGSLVATTTFVTGHSYLQTGFSTATTVREVGEAEPVDLESFTLTIDGKEVDPVDRNVWGVTFAHDDTTFYATVGTGARTYLVRGDLVARTLTSLRENAECPSLSPDGSQVAYKVAEQGDPHWRLAVLDLATGEQTVLGAEDASVDDQVEWLDDDTLLYGMPRADEPGVTDVWSLDTRADAVPHLLVAEAWSPAVVRP